jgi:capsular polysaccharide biosynthesis protein
MSQHEALAGRVVRVGHVVDTIRRGWLPLLACILASIAVAGALFTVVPASYTSRAAVALTPSGTSAGSGSGNATEVNTATESAVVTSSSVAEQAAKLLGSSNVGDLTDHVVVTSPIDSQILEIRFTASSPTAAAAGANAFAKAYLTFRRTLAASELQSRADRIQQRIEVLEKAAADARALRSASTSSAAVRAQAAAQQQSAEQLARELRGQLVNLETVVVSPGDIVDRALPPQTRNFPRLPVFLVTGALLGTIAGLVLAFMRGNRNPRITGEADLEPLVGDRILVPVPVALGRHSLGRPLAILSQDGGEETDAYRSLASKLTLSSTKHTSYLLLPAGDPYRGEAPLNLAVTMAAQGLRVALLGSDAATAHAAAKLGLSGEQHSWPHDDDRGPDRSGLREVVRLGQLRIVSFGDEVVVDATLRHQQPRLTALIEQLDVLIVDGMNVTMPSTRLSLSRLADDAIVVVSQGRSGVHDVHHALSELAQVSMPARGVILLQPRRARQRRGEQPLDLSRLHTSTQAQTTAAEQVRYPTSPVPPRESSGTTRVGNGP